MPVATARPGNPAVPDALRALVTPLRVGVALAAIAAIFVALWPLGMSGDYLNHLARNHIEANVWSDPVFQRNFFVEFALIPDLAMDMVVPWLSHLIGTYEAGAVMVWVALAGPPLAGLLISRTLHGRVTWLSLLGFLAMFNANMQWGFVNFVVAVAAALAGFALWMRLSPSWRRAAIFAPFGVFLVFCHALGFLLLGYLALLWEIGCYAQRQRGAATDFIRQLATRDAAAMLPALVILAATAEGGAQQLTHVGTTDFDILQKILALWSGADFFNPTLGKLVTLALGCGVWIGLRRGVLSIDPRMMWVCAGMLVLVLAMPTSLLGIWGLHFRFPATLIVVVSASIALAPDAGRRMRAVIMAAGGALIAGVYVNGSVHMAQIDAQARALGSLLTNLPEGARVLPARDPDVELIHALHASGMAVIEKSAYVPNLFTNTSPVAVRHEMRDLHMPQAWPLLIDDLEQSAGEALPASANGYWSPAYHYGWPVHWDYVLFLRSEPGSTLDLPQLCAKAETPSAVLYRIAKAGCGAG